MYDKWSLDVLYTGFDDPKFQNEFNQLDEFVERFKNTVETLSEKDARTATKEALTLVEEYQEAIEKSFSYEDEVVIEPYIKGREFACGIIDGKALPVIEIIPKTGFFDYANKYQAGATEEICPAQIPDEVAERMQRATELAFKSLKLDVYSRADFLWDANDDIYCLEVNTLPGMTSASLLPQEARAAGIEYGDLCELIIQKSLERYNA